MYHFFFNDSATTEIYTLSLHDALPILGLGQRGRELAGVEQRRQHRAELGVVELGGGILREVVEADLRERDVGGGDRKSTRLNSSHSSISYAVFCLKKKKTNK